MVLSKCLLLIRKDSTLFEFVLFHLVYIESMEICCHHNWVFRINYFQMFNFYASFMNIQQSFWRASLFAGLNQNLSIWTGLFYTKDMFITKRGSQLPRLLLLPSLMEFAAKLSETMLQWLILKNFVLSAMLILSYFVQVVFR